MEFCAVSTRCRFSVSASCCRFPRHWILTQYTKGVWEQLAVSAAGILIMVGIAWFLNRAAKVPDPSLSA